MAERIFPGRFMSEKFGGSFLASYDEEVIDAVELNYTEMRRITRIQNLSVKKQHYLPL